MGVKRLCGVLLAESKISVAQYLRVSTGSTKQKNVLEMMEIIQARGLI